MAMHECRADWADNTVHARGRMRRGNLIGVVFVAGCQGGRGIHSDANGPEIIMQLLPGDSLSRVDFSGRGGACVTFDESLHGTYGGFELSVDSLGMPIAGGCSGPQLSIMLAGRALSNETVDVSDENQSVSATFE